MLKSKMQVKRGFILRAIHEFDINSVYYKKGSKWLVKKTGSNVELELIRNRSQIAKGIHEGETLITVRSDCISGTFELSNPQVEKPKFVLEVVNLVTNKSIKHIDEFPELLRSFSENLAEHSFRTGSERVSQKPATLKSLVENLNKAEKLTRQPEQPIYKYMIGTTETNQISSSI